MFTLNFLDRARPRPIRTRLNPSCPPFVHSQPERDFQIPLTPVRRHPRLAGSQTTSIDPLINPMYTNALPTLAVHSFPQGETGHTPGAAMIITAGVRTLTSSGSTPSRPLARDPRIPRFRSRRGAPLRYDWEEKGEKVEKGEKGERGEEGAKGEKGGKAEMLSSPLLVPQVPISGGRVTRVDEPGVGLGTAFARHKLPRQRSGKQAPMLARKASGKRGPQGHPRLEARRCRGQRGLQRQRRLVGVGRQ